MKFCLITILTRVSLSLCVFPNISFGFAISDLFFNGISGSQKDCDLPKTTVLHGSNTFGQLQSQTPNVTDNTTSNNNTRLHVSSGLCDSHNMHPDQVIIPIVPIVLSLPFKVYMCRQLFRITIKTINRNDTGRASRRHS